jgi:5-methylcytosine-specific restriction endonuclease McrA
MPNAHYISRAKGGLGIEQNVVTLCIKCHHDYDNGSKRHENAKKIKEYLKSLYGEKWKEENLIYNKWKDI